MNIMTCKLRRWIFNKRHEHLLPTFSSKIRSLHLGKLTSRWTQRPYPNFLRKLGKFWFDHNINLSLFLSIYLSLSSLYLYHIISPTISLSLSLKFYLTMSLSLSPSLLSSNDSLICWTYNFINNKTSPAPLTIKLYDALNYWKHQKVGSFLFEA